MDLKQAKRMLRRQLDLGRELMATRNQGIYESWEIFTAQILSEAFPVFEEPFKKIDQLNMMTRLIYQTSMIETAIQSIELLSEFDPEIPAPNTEALARAVAARMAGRASCTRSASVGSGQ